MRIGFIVPYLYRFQRGIEASACRLASALDGLGHEVTMMTWSHRPAAAVPVLSPNVRVRAVPYFRYFRSRVAVPFYTRFLRQGRFDLVNIYFADCGEAAAIRKTKSKADYRVQFIAGYPVELVPHRFDAFDRLGLTPLVDRVVAKSPPMVASLEDRMGRPTVMIPNGVDTAVFSPELFSRDVARREFGVGSDEKVVVSVAALEERKGVQHVLRAMPRLLERGVGLRFLIAGEGRFRSSLEAEVADLGLTSRVHFLGAVDDVRPLLASADVLALISHGEGFPNVLLEAWAMGLPVIVSDHPPYPDLVSADLGLRVDEAFPSGVADGLAAMFESTSDRDRPRRRQFVKEHYSWSTIAESVVALDSNLP